MKTLHLNVKKEFFDMIKSGEKKEEYREVKIYWFKRLVKKYKAIAFKINNGYGFINDNEVLEFVTNHRTAGRFSFKEYEYIQFKNGYQKNASTLLIECRGIRVGKPNPNWVGKQFDGKDDVFIIKLGDINEVKG